MKELQQRALQGGWRVAGERPKNGPRTAQLLAVLGNVCDWLMLSAYTIGCRTMIGFSEGRGNPNS